MRWVTVACRLNLITNWFRRRGPFSLTWGNEFTPQLSQHWVARPSVPCMSTWTELCRRSCRPVRPPSRARRLPPDPGPGPGERNLSPHIETHPHSNGQVHSSSIKPDNNTKVTVWTRASLVVIQDSDVHKGIWVSHVPHPLLSLSFPTSSRMY